MANHVNPFSLADLTRLPSLPFSLGVKSSPLLIGDHEMGRTVIRISRIWVLENPLGARGKELVA